MYRRKYMRADALATKYFFHPLRRLIPPSQGRVPILMYHSISDVERSARHPYYETATSPEVFAQHMQFLAQNNYRPLRLAEAVRYMADPGQETARPVVITFDDGYRDFYTHAFPILAEHGFTATVFLPTASIGNTTRRLHQIECLTWGEVEELHKAGIDFGSHTVTHPQLKLLDATMVESEILCSKETIDERLGGAVRSFAYPYAFPEIDQPFRGLLRDVLNHAGYENGVCTIIGTAGPRSERFFLERLPMNTYDDPALFRAKLEGAYDWLHPLQYATKLINTRSTA
ncbi:MAG: polysaccharide deacetylase family protein [Bryobacterales bacterium]|nr:polysaccharide deacetylase family protein [Bryobacterales bacterium]